MHGNNQGSMLKISKEKAKICSTKVGRNYVRMYARKVARNYAKKIYTRGKKNQA